MAEAKTIPQHDQIPVESTWDTTAIYPTDEAWEKEFAEVRAQIPVLAGYAGRLGENAQTLWDYLTLCDKTMEQVTRLYQYASLRQDEDTRNGTYQALAGKGTSLWVELSSATAFDTPELLKLSRETLERFYAEKPELELYRRYFPQGAGSIFTFRVKGGEAAALDFCNRLQIFSLLANVADGKSLVIHPASTTHAQMSREEQAAAGISPDTIRLSIGTEHIDDILWDLGQALGH